MTENKTEINRTISLLTKKLINTMCKYNINYGTLLDPNNFENYLTEFATHCVLPVELYNEDGTSVYESDIKSSYSDFKFDPIQYQIEDGTMSVSECFKNENFDNLCMTKKSKNNTKKTSKKTPKEPSPEKLRSIKKAELM